MIKSDETEIRGAWVNENGGLMADATSRRIELIIAQCLKELDRDQGGWDVLYIDPDDRRLWELTYPQSDMQGGGPPLLRWIRKQDAEKKYPHFSEKL